MKHRTRHRAGSGTVRIIGGRWRGRKLGVANQKGLRPSADRTRETLFNWLQSTTPGARVLDLFAGSGALGFEALSRGATRAILVERNKTTAAALSNQARELGAESCTVVCADALEWLNRRTSATENGFDLVFLDPPFDSKLLPRAAQLLECMDWLAEDALIYAEFSPEKEPADWPERWTILRRGGSREAACILFRRQTSNPGDQL